MTTFIVYENALEQAYKWVDKSTISSAGHTGVNIGSGLIAGVAAAIVSQPADTMLSKINKEKGEVGEGTLRRLWKVAKGMTIRSSFAGIRARVIMVGGMTATQFAIYGDIKKVCPPSAALFRDSLRSLSNKSNRLLVPLAGSKSSKCFCGTFVGIDEIIV